MQPAKSIAIGLTAMLLLANAANPERKLRMDHVQDAIDAIYEAIDAKDPAAVTVQTRAMPMSLSSNKACGAMPASPTVPDGRPTAPTARGRLQVPPEMVWTALQRGN
jgi:hypothetical protein